MPRVVCKVILATQNPRRVVFMECRRRDRCVPAIEVMPDGEMPVVGCHVFEYLPLKFYDHSNVPVVTDYSVAVACDVIYADALVHFIGHAIDFTRFVRYHPKSCRQPSQSKDGTSRKTRVSSEVLTVLML